MYNYCNQIVTSLVKNEIISKDDSSIYMYGLHELWMLVLNFATMFIVGFITNMLFESILFTISFTFLRRFSGGAHAKTRLRCYFTSIFILTFALLIIALFEKVIISNLITITMLCIFIFLKLVPVANVNKTLDDKEFYIYKKRGISRLVIILSLSILSLILKEELIHIILTVSIMFNVTSMSFGAYKNKQNFNLI